MSFWAGNPSGPIHFQALSGLSGLGEEVSYMERLEIDDDNCKQLIFDWVMEKFRDEIKEAVDDFPYDNSDLDEELAFKNFMDWFILERKRPQTGKSPAIEFTEHFEMDPEIKKKIIQTQQTRFGVFKILEAIGDEKLLMEDVKTGKTYNVVLIEPNDVYKKDRILETRFHPWGDAYRFSGIVKVKLDPEEAARRLGLITPSMMGEIMDMFEKDRVSDAERILIYPHSTITSILNKYPAQWVDGICDALGIPTNEKKNVKTKHIAATLCDIKNLSEIVEELPEKSMEALKFVLDKGGLVKYNQLSRNYDDEITYAWSEHPPESTIGLLRLHGLLFVGRMAIGSRLYKVGLIPSELRGLLLGLLKENTKLGR